MTECEGVPERRCASEAHDCMHLRLRADMMAHMMRAKMLHPYQQALLRFRLIKPGPQYGQAQRTTTCEMVKGVSRSDAMQASEAYRQRHRGQHRPALTWPAAAGHTGHARSTLTRVNLIALTRAAPGTRQTSTSAPQPSAPSRHRWHSERHWHEGEGADASDSQEGECHSHDHEHQRQADHRNDWR